MFDVADIDDEIRERPLDGERVSARMNLNNKTIIVKRRNSTNGEYGEMLVQSPSPVVLRDVEFRVQDKSHERVVDSGSRYACAYAVGVYVRDLDRRESYQNVLMRVDQLGVRVAYNPFRSKYFHIPEFARDKGTDGDIPIQTADRLVLWSEQTEDGIKGRMRGVGVYPHEDAL